MDIDENIKRRICDISEKYNPDYPNIKNETILARLWAIECSLEGTLQANDYCHKVINILQKQLNLSNDTIVKIFENIMGE